MLFESSLCRLSIKAHITDTCNGFFLVRFLGIRFGPKLGGLVKFGTVIQVHFGNFCILRIRRFWRTKQGLERKQRRLDGESGRPLVFENVLQNTISENGTEAKKRVSTGVDTFLRRGPIVSFSWILPDKSRQFARKCWGARFWCETSSWVVQTDIVSECQCQFERSHLRRECLLVPLSSRSGLLDCRVSPERPSLQRLRHLSQLLRVPSTDE